MQLHLNNLEEGHMSWAATGTQSVAATEKEKSCQGDE